MMRRPPDGMAYRNESYLMATCGETIMDRDSFIRVLEGCISSATGREYKHIEWTQMSDRGLVECAELVRDLLEKRLRDLDSVGMASEPRDRNIH